MARKSVKQEVSYKSVKSECLRRVSSKSVKQGCPTRASPQCVKSSQGVPQVGSLEIAAIRIKSLFLTRRHSGSWASSCFLSFHLLFYTLLFLISGFLSIFSLHVLSFSFIVHSIHFLSFPFMSLTVRFDSFYMFLSCLLIFFHVL